jgi:hypothetical protein
VAVEQAAQASPTGNLARKVRAVFEGAEDVVQAAAALRMHTAERASFAQETCNRMGCSADALTVKEYQDMLGRYKVKYYSTAMLSPDEDNVVHEQVSVHAFRLRLCSVPFLCMHSLRLLVFGSRISCIIVFLQFLSSSTLTIGVLHSHMHDCRLHSMHCSAGCD